MSKLKSPRATAKHNQILSAASALFLQHGYAGTSMDHIANEAGVSKQTLYAYYPAKDALFSTVLENVILRLSEGGLQLPLRSGSPANVDELHCALLQLAEAIAHSLMRPDYLALVKVIIAEITLVPELGQLFRESVPHRVLAAIAAVLEQSRQSGVIQLPEPDVEQAARMFVGPILTYVLLDGLMTATPPCPPDRETLDRLVRLYIRSLV